MGAPFWLINGSIRHDIGINSGTSAVGAHGGTDRWGACANLPAIAALEEAELVDVCTAREETVKRTQQRTGARLAFCDYAEMLHSPEVDLHPERRNVVTQGMWLQIGEILEDFAKDEAIRVVVLKEPSDKALVSSADISQFGEQRRSAEEVAVSSRTAFTGKRPPAFTGH